MQDFSISMSGTKAEVVAQLNALEGPPTDSPVYAHHCHAKQHTIDFVSRLDPSQSCSVSVNGNPRTISLTFTAS